MAIIRAIFFKLPFSNIANIWSLLYVYIGPIPSFVDTFASKVAAINDETADASVGNVAGSNAVNVFLGIGVAWSLASIYHAANGTKFVVQGGSLGFSVLLFCILALICLSVMMWRRFNKNIGAELGGPQPYKKVTSIFFGCLWITYIIGSALETYCYIPSFWCFLTLCLKFGRWIARETVNHCSGSGVWTMLLFVLVYRRNGYSDHDESCLNPLVEKNAKLFERSV